MKSHRTICTRTKMSLPKFQVMIVMLELMVMLGRCWFPIGSKPFSGKSNNNQSNKKLIVLKNNERDIMF